jgi:Short C-terminal domain
VRDGYIDGHMVERGRARRPSSSGALRGGRVQCMLPAASGRSVERGIAMMRRRRPLRRAAVVGGVAVAAHHAGARSAQAQADEQAQYQEPAPAPPQAPAAAAPAAGSGDLIGQLESLKKLLDEGVLTQAEFDTQKQKLLASS